MKLATIVKASFIISLVNTILGAYLKITHSAEADTLLITGVLATLVFIVSVIIEVRTSTKIDNIEKTMWTVGFILFSGIAGLIYFLSGRKRIAMNPQATQE